MSKKRMLFIILLFILVLISFRIPWMLLSDNKNRTEADQGVVDLRNWNLDNNDFIHLDGEWEFYPNSILMPSEIKENAEMIKRETIQVPSDWSNYVANTDSEENTGTYRLRVLVGDEQLEGLYKIQLPRRTAVSKMFINNELVIDNHFVSEEIRKQDPNLINRSASFWASEMNEIEILIHVVDKQNFREKGIVKSIKFGKESAVNLSNYISIAMQLLVVVIIFIHFIYSIVLFILRRKNVEYLYFAFTALCAIIATLLDDDKLLLFWLDINYISSVKIVFLAYIGISVFFMLFIRTLITEYKSNKIIRSIIILHIIFALLIVFSPLHQLSIIARSTFVVIAISFALIAKQMWQGVKKGKSNLLFLLLAIIAITMSFLWGLYKSSNLVELPYYPTDIIIAFIAFSIYLFRNIFKISDENEKLTIQLQQEMKQKDNFLANTSHELRNPLHGIINIAQSVLQHGDNSLTDHHKKNLGILINIGYHMSQTLNDLLDITQLKEQNIQLHKTELNLHTTALGVIDMLKIMIENKNIRLELSISNSIPNVIADKKRLIQILYNLLHNAMKFTDEGVISIRADIQHDMAIIHIKDTGIGMSDETMSRIFQPYEQGDASITAMGGIGLGLNICKQLVEMHGGIMEVHSVLHEGSKFSFTLPLAKDSQVKQTIDLNQPKSEKDILKNISMSAIDIPAVPKNNYLTFRPRILVVDDDSVNLNVLSNILSADQYDIVTVTSGVEALHQLPKMEWDLIITDVMMPHMTGYELTRIIREKFSILELPVLLLTARNQPEDIYTGFLAGANDYVVKPANALELKIRVNTLANFKKSISEHLHIEAAWLQAQIRPHFLFNTLNTIASLHGSEADTERLVDLLEQFGHYLRRSFDPKNLDRVVPIEHELDLVRSYLYIEKERFGDRLHVVWEVEDNLSLFVPPLSIQTLVENAVQHGILKCVQGGKLCLRICERSGFTEIAIIDDGTGMDEEQVQQVLKDQTGKNKGIGLPNTNKRLLQLYGEGLQIRSTPGEGTIVTFKIPKRYVSKEKSNESK